MLDGAVFSRTVHGLKDEQHRPSILGKQELREVVQATNPLVQQAPRIFIGVERQRVGGIVLIESQTAPGGHA